MTKESVSKKYLFWAIEIVLIVLSVFILKDYIVPLVSAYVLAFLVKPVFNRMSPKLGKPLAAAICIVAVIIIIVLPMAIMINTLIQQSSLSLNQGTLDSLLTRASEWPILQQFNLDIVLIKQKALGFFFGLLTSVLYSIPHFVLALLVTGFGMFYALLHWESLSNKLTTYLPFPDKEAVRDKLASATRGIVYGYLLIALIELFVAALGFYISGVKFALLLASLVALLVFIPGLGPAAVWVPTALYYLVTGSMGTALGVLITGIVLGFGIDQFVTPNVVGRKAKIHPFIMLLGVLGGIPVFGIFGFIIGPLILIYAIKLLGEAADQNVY